MTWKICTGIGCECAGGSGCGCSVECNPGLCEGFSTCGCEYPWCGCIWWDQWWRWCRLPHGFRVPERRVEESRGGREYLRRRERLPHGLGVSERRPVRSRGWRTTRAIGESLDKAGVRAQGAVSAPVMGVHARCATSPPGGAMVGADGGRTGCDGAVGPSDETGVRTRSATGVGVARMGPRSVTSPFDGLTARLGNA
jgi:hypothetical protein